MIAEIALQFIAWSEYIVVNFGYLGIFLINLIGSATIVLPILPAFIVVIGFATILNPWLIGLSAGLGCAIGELSGYFIGRGGREIITKKYEKWLKLTKKWVEKHGAFPIIVLFAATPLPHDVVGVFSGIINYDVKRFLLATFIGKTILNIVLAWSGFYGMTWVMNVLGGV